MEQPGEGSLAVEFVCPALTSLALPEDNSGPEANPHQKFKFPMESVLLIFKYFRTSVHSLAQPLVLLLFKTAKEQVEKWAELNKGMQGLLLS